MDADEHKRLMELHAANCRRIAGSKSPKKAAASRENGKLGGRPRKIKPEIERQGESDDPQE